MTADFDGRRVDLAREDDFRLGAIQVRPAARQIESGGTSETLEPRIMQVLVALARRRGEVVSRDELIETCWEGRVVGDDALNRCVAKIRKIGEASGAFRLETIPRVGYRLHAKAAADSTGAPVETVPKPVKRRWLVPAAAAAAGLVVSVAALAWWTNLNSRTVDVAAPLLMAVLPFETPEGDKEAEALASAIQPAIVAELSRANVSVVASARTAPFTGQLKSQAADALGAGMLVDGNIVRNGDILRVFVRIDHTKSGVTLLATTMDGDAHDTGAFVYRLSATIAGSVSWSGAVQILNLDRPDSAEIATLWLNQLSLISNGDPLAAFAITSRMVRMAPDLPEVHLAHAIAGISSLRMTAPANRPAQWREARSSARIAREKSPDGGSYLAMMLATPAPRWAERESYLTAGSKADIANGSQVRSLSGLYLAAGRIGLSQSTIKEARSRNPLAPNMMMQQAMTHLAAGQPDEARKTLAEVERQKGPTFAAAIILQAETAVWWAGPEETRAAIDAASLSGSPVSTGELALIRLIVAAARSHADKDVAAVRSACDAAAGDAGVQLICLSAGGGLGLVDLSFVAADRLFPDMRKSLSDAEDTGWLAAPDIIGQLPHLFMPWTASIRADPRIIDVFERTGLLAYWRETGNWPDFCETEPQSVCAQMKAGQ